MPPSNRLCSNGTIFNVPYTIGIGFVDSLLVAVDNLKSAFTYVKRGPTDDSYIGNMVKTRNQSSVTILNSIAICSIQGVPCDYLQCLTENFQQGQMLNAKKVGRLMIDPELRRTILENEAVLALACNMSNLNQLQCLAFKEFLNLMDLLDPPESHINDEPRDKRSATELNVTNSDIGHLKLGMSNISDLDSIYDYYDGSNSDGGRKISTNLTTAVVPDNVGEKNSIEKNCTKLLPKKSTTERKTNKTSTKGRKVKNSTKLSLL